MIWKICRPVLGFAATFFGFLWLIWLHQRKIRSCISFYESELLFWSTRPTLNLVIYSFTRWLVRPYSLFKNLAKHSNVIIWNWCSVMAWLWCWPGGSLMTHVDPRSRTKSRPIVITIFAHVVRPTCTFQHQPKQNRSSLLAEWIIDDSLFWCYAITIYPFKK